MSLPKLCTLAAFVLSASSALAEDARLVGTWHPDGADARHIDVSMLVFNEAGRFAALIRPLPEADPQGLAAVSGTYTLGVDGGEVVLSLDNPAQEWTPGAKRYVQMLLLDDELRPYPGMEDRSPVASTIWRKTAKPIAGIMQ